MQLSSRRPQRRARRASLLLAALVLPLVAIAAEEYHGRRVWSLQNEQIRVLVAPGGGHIASMELRSGRGAGMNPLWLPPWPSVEPGEWAKADGAYGDPPEAQLLAAILGHNLCLDFFGGPSPAETAAGISVHGEAPVAEWKAREQSPARLVYSAELAAAQMRVTREIGLTPASSAIWITETVENRSALDRPFGWQQHPTLGPPFLQEGKSFFDASATWSMVNPSAFSEGMRLKRGAEFQWPNAPLAAGGTVDLRDWPKGERSSDYTTSLIDPTATWGWWTAINTERGLLIGYAWPRAEWPWLDNWEENRFRTAKPWSGRAVTRGMEFGTTPFPESRRDAVTLAKLHDTPTYRWIGARERQRVAYTAFLAPVPPGTTGARSVVVDRSSVQIELKGVNETLRLPLRRE